MLVQGTGGVSLFAAQLAVAQGLRVIATTTRPEKAAALRRLGVSEVIAAGGGADWAAEVLRATGGIGVDHVVEVGGPGTFAGSLQAVRAGGTVSLVGVLTGFAGQVDPMAILYKGVRVEGVLVGTVRALEELARAVGAWRLRPVVDEVVAMERAPAALAKLAAQRHLGKIVIAVG